MYFVNLVFKTISGLKHVDFNPLFVNEIIFPKGKQMKELKLVQKNTELANHIKQDDSGACHSMADVTSMLTKDSRVVWTHNCGAKLQSMLHHASNPKIDPVDLGIVADIIAVEGPDIWVGGHDAVIKFRLENKQYVQKAYLNLEPKILLGGQAISTFKQGKYRFVLTGKGFYRFDNKNECQLVCKAEDHKFDAFVACMKTKKGLKLVAKRNSAKGLWVSCENLQDYYQVMEHLSSNYAEAAMSRNGKWLMAAGNAWCDCCNHERSTLSIHLLGMAAPYACQSMVVHTNLKRENMMPALMHVTSDNKHLIVAHEKTLILFSLIAGSLSEDYRIDLSPMMSESRHNKVLAISPEGKHCFWLAVDKGLFLKFKISE